MKSLDRKLLEELITELELKYNFGNRNTWTHQDFEKIVGMLNSTSNYNVSVSTIKRLYGKIKSEATPRISTLDSIAIHLGYNSWYDFVQTKKGKRTPIKKNKSKKAPKKIMSIIAFLIAIIGISFFVNHRVLYNIDSEDFVFRSDDTLGFNPHLVKIETDLSKLKGGGFYISHDNKETKIQKNDTTYSFFTRKYGINRFILFKRNKELKRIKVFVGTNGWVANVTNDDGQESFFNEKEIRQDSTVTVRNGVFQNNIKLKDFDEAKYFFADLTEIQLDEFVAEARFRYVIIDGYDPCIRSNFNITGTKSYISIPSGHPSCLKGMYIHFGQKKYSIQDKPDEFGISNTWQKIRIEKKKDKAIIYRNDKQIFEILLETENEKDWGFFFMAKFQFIGNGEVDYFKLWKEGKLLINQD